MSKSVVIIPTAAKTSALSSPASARPIEEGGRPKGVDRRTAGWIGWAAMLRLPLAWAEAEVEAEAEAEAEVGAGARIEKRR